MVVSLTTFPLRIGKVHLTIQSILRQSRPADRILLWLSKEEFPEEAQLPANLLRLKENRQLHQPNSRARKLPAGWLSS